MVSKVNKKLILVLILAAILRLVSLGSIPAGISPDEISQGYTAYSLLKTGHDEWGVSWPLTSFRSFVDYKAPLQTYLMIPSVALFGLNEFAIRLPSALFGILSIYVIYLLVTELFGQGKGRTLTGGVLNDGLASEANGRFDLIGLLAAFILAISPWHIQFSRTALEVNLSSLLFPLGLYLFLKGLKKPKLLIYSSLIWGLNLYSYHAAKFFLPLFLVPLVFINLSSLKKLGIKKLAMPIVILLFFLLPSLYLSFFSPVGTRNKDLIITNLNQSQLASISSEQYLSPLNELSPQLSRVFHNKLSFMADQFASNYLSYLTPTFWFTEGGHETTYSIIPGRGLLYLWQLPFVVLGLISLIFIKNKTTKAILLSWLLLAAIPAALTKEGYRPNRAGSFLVFWEIITAFGLIQLFKQKFKYKRAIKYFLVTIILISSVFYIEDYAVSAPIRFPNSLSFGYRDLMTKLVPLESDFDQIIIDKGTQSQSFVAFYKQIDPVVFQSYSSGWWERFQKTDFLYLDMLDDYQLEKYRFKTIHFPEDLLGNTLLVTPAKTLDHQYLPFVFDTIYYPNREPFLYLLKSK
jgi:4-amino-4-deoxy-L-arabinose transferase-like glycosyltransferase